MQIFFSAGEPSGDLHGANLIEAIRRSYPQATTVGFGGPRMASAGCHLLKDLTSLSVMGFLPVLWNFVRFWRLLWQADRHFRQNHPQAVVLIDYPGFNWWVARRAKAHGIPVYYYSPPQIWGWARWRVKKMRRLVDHVYCGLPFEEAWLRENGCQATYVGHPYFDELEQRCLDRDFLQRINLDKSPLVTILPGSRSIEVSRNLKTLLDAAELIRHSVPKVRFAIACCSKSHATQIRGQLGERATAIQVFAGQTPELIEAANCCMAVSGSVSLELLYHAKPAVILYKVPPMLYFLQNIFRKVKYVTLVNLLNTDALHPPDLKLYSPDQPDAGRVLFPEYVVCRHRPELLARHLIEWLGDPVARARCASELVRLRHQVASPGAAAKAATCMLESLPQSNRKRRELLEAA